MRFEQAECIGAWVASEAPRDGAHAAFHELYRRHATMTERYIAARVHSWEVADVHHKRWTKAWDHAEQFSDGIGYRVLLLTNARNTINDDYRAAAICSWRRG